MQNRDTKPRHNRSPFSIRHRVLIGDYEPLYVANKIGPLTEVMDLVGPEFDEAKEWLSNRRPPFGSNVSSEGSFIRFAVPKAQGAGAKATVGLLEDFFAMTTGSEAFKFAKRHGILWQSQSQMGEEPRPHCFIYDQTGWKMTHYEPVEYWLRMAALFRLVRKVIYWLSQSEDERNRTLPLMVFVGKKGEVNPKRPYGSFCEIRLEKNDSHFSASGFTYTFADIRWWTEVLKFNDLFGGPGGKPDPDHNAYRWYLERMERSAFVGSDLTYLEFIADTFIQSVLASIIRSECRIDLGYKGTTVQNSSLLGVMAHQLAELYRSRGNPARLCCAPGCNKPIPDHRRPQAKYCDDTCKDRVSSKKGAAKRKRKSDLAREKKSKNRSQIPR